MAPNTNILFGISVIFCLLALARPAFGCTQAGTAACPTYVCNSTVGIPGRIYQTNSYLVGKFGTDPRDLSMITSDTQCKELCQRYPACVYWNHLQSATNGTCILLKGSACLNTFTYESTSTCLSNSAVTQTTGSICSTLPSPPPDPTSPPPTTPPPATIPSTDPPLTDSPPPSPTVGVSGDPHYTGADNSHFDFTGLPAKTYCMLSDSHLHINVYHGGRFDRWGTNPHKPLTWIRQIALFWGHHIVYLAVREGSDWEYGNGYLKEITVDGTQVVLKKPSDYVTFFDNQMKIKWVAAKKLSGDDEVDVYKIEIEAVIKMVLILRPEIALLRTKDDGVVHFSIEIPQVSVSSNVHGILGQTFRPDHQDRLYKQKPVRSDLLKVDVVPGDNGEGFLDGDVTDYQTKDLFKPNCVYSRFARTDKIDEETAAAIETRTRSAVESGYRSTLPRKMAVE